MNSTANKRLTIDLPENLHTKLKILAAERHETMGSIIRTCLEKEMAKIDKK